MWNGTQFRFVYDATCFMSRNLFVVPNKIMEALPNELLAHILAFLHPVNDNLAFLSLVCKRWKAVIEETPCLWKCIHLTQAYPFGSKENTRHRNILRLCLMKFGRHINCLREHAITKTFTDPSLRDLVVGLTSLTCLDVPLLEWDVMLLKRLRCASTLEELNLTQYLDSEPLELMPWLFQQPFPRKKNFLTPHHLQIIRYQFPRLKVLKLALDSVAFPPSTFLSFLSKVNLTSLELFGFGLLHTLPPQIIHYRDLCLKTIASSQRLAAMVTRLELRTCPLCFTTDHLRVIIKLMKSLRHLFVGSGMIHRDCKSLLSIESDSLLTLGIDGLSTLRMQCLRCNTPNLKEFYLANCLALNAVFVYSEYLELLCLRNLSSFYNLKCSSCCLIQFEVAACPVMPVSALRNFLTEHQTVKRLALIGELSGLTLYDYMCSSLQVLNVLLYRVSRLSSIKVDCSTLETFVCDVYKQTPATRINLQCGSIADVSSTCSIFIRSRKLERVSINLPNVRAICVRCEELKYLSIMTSEMAGNRNTSLDLEVLARSVSIIYTKDCTFSRYYLRANHIESIILQSCELESSDQSIPRLNIQTKSIDKVAIENCHNLECAELRFQAGRTSQHMSFTECNNLRTIVMSCAAKHFPQISISRCRNLNSILLPSGNQLDLSNVEAFGRGLSFSIPKEYQSYKKLIRLGESCCNKASF